MSKYIEILALEKKPVTDLAIGDILANPKYAERAFKKFQESDLFKSIAAGKAYYAGKNTFIDEWQRKALFQVGGQGGIKGTSSGFINREDLYKDEIKIKNPYFSDMINQLAEFVLSEKPTFTDTTEKPSAEEEVKENNKPKKETLLEWIETKWKHLDLHVLFKKQLIEMLIKAYSGTNFRVEDGKSIIEPAPAETFAFLYDSTTAQTPACFIIATNVESTYISTDGDKDKWITDKAEKYLVITKDAIVEHTKSKELGWISVDKSYKKVTDIPEEVQVEGEPTTFQSQSLITPYIPFSFMTTETLHTELYKIKDIIDAADLNDTDSINELIRLVKTLWVIKGSTGESIEALDKLIKAGILSVDEQGDAKAIEGNEATEQRISKGVELKGKIYRFSKAIDLEKLQSLANTSSVAIKALYEPLLQKSNSIEVELEYYIKDVLKKLYMVEHVADNTSKEDLDTKFENIEMSFNESMISNITEDLTAAGLQMGKVSLETYVAQHPYFKGKSQEEIDAEVDRIKEEQGEAEV